MPDAEPGGTPTVTVGQMREVDALAVSMAGVSLMQMMENAGRGIAVLTRRRLGGDVRGRRVTILAGTGGNGGGGLVAARRLTNWGASVDVVLTVAPTALRGLIAHQLRALALTDATVHAPSESELVPGGVHPVVGALAIADAVVDAIIGYGISGPPRGVARALIELANGGLCPVFALDLPSGLDPDTGIPAPTTIRATTTMTLALPNVGLMLPPARDHVGELFLLDIGIPPSVLRRVGTDVGDLFAHEDLVRLPPRKQSTSGSPDALAAASWRPAPGVGLAG